MPHSCGDVFEYDGTTGDENWSCGCSDGCLVMVVRNCLFNCIGVSRCHVHVVTMSRSHASQSHTIFIVSSVCACPRRELLECQAGWHLISHLFQLRARGQGARVLRQEDAQEEGRRQVICRWSKSKRVTCCNSFGSGGNCLERKPISVKASNKGKTSSTP